MNKSVLLGPYIGSFTQEILSFRPYIKYISEILSSDTNIYISSHSNRSFLYEWIDADNFIPVYEHLTRNEPSQVGFIHEKVTKTEFNQISRFICNQIGKDKIDVYNLPYAKNVNGISYYEKLYTPFSIPELEIEEDVDVVGVFNTSPQSKEVFNELQKIFNVLVIGNMNNGIEDNNIILKNIIFMNNYIKMFNYIKKAKLVVTNCNDWVVICNLQKIPVFYWGSDFSLYRSESIFNFDNKKCKSICEMDTGDIIKMIKFYYNQFSGE